MMTLAWTLMHLSAATVVGADLTPLAVPSAEHTVTMITSFLLYLFPLLTIVLITDHPSMLSLDSFTALYQHTFTYPCINAL
ncbi:hypothetical protein BD769DRAFT_1500430 [Suillus cothurnatus]|nr:hypothetical protein BD769DRAFT_1500430 [Suillus cothurnatus]